VHIWKGFLALALLVVFGLSPEEIWGGDWPTYQHDIRRSGVTAERLVPPLAEQWVFESRHAPVPAWGDPQPKAIEGNLELPRLRFDDAFHVAAVADAVYFGSSADHMVHALDASTGELRWSAYTGGPVRLAPTVWQRKLYVGSDDGFVYCLDTADGRELWKFRAAPHPDKVLGNGRLISLWPVRTGVLIDKGGAGTDGGAGTNGIAYFAAGVFPSEGLYLYAVNAETGELIWKNDAYARGGLGELSPQGYLLASASRLFVPSGRCVPGAFDRSNGRGLYQPMLSWRREGLFGGTYALLAGDHLYNGTEQILAYTQTTGKLVHSYPGHRIVFAKDSAYLMTGKEVLGLDRKAYPAARKRERALEQKAASLGGLRKSLAAARAELAEIRIETIQAELAALDEKLESLRPRPHRQSKEYDDLTKKRDALNKQLQDKIRRRDSLAKKIAETRAKIDSIAKEETEVKRLVEEATRWRCPFVGRDALILAGDVLFAGGKDRVIGQEGLDGEGEGHCPRAGGGQRTAAGQYRRGHDPRFLASGGASTGGDTSVGGDLAPSYRPAADSGRAVSR